MPSADRREDRRERCRQRSAHADGRGQVPARRELRRQRDGRQGVAVDDDDRHPVVGRKIAWFVDGKAAGTTTTSSTGHATHVAKAGQKVKVVFTGPSPAYSGSSATKKV